jgi:hypothetical protein
VETHIFEPWAARCRRARRRVMRGFAPEVGASAAAAAFSDCLAELRGLGLRGNALVVAAEYMASTRLRTSGDARVLEPV